MPKDSNRQQFIRVLRMQAQLLTQPAQSPLDVVRHMGAIQSQDLPMSLWALALRTHKTNMAEIHSLFASGALLRTHLLRPTWHLVENADISWMIDLSAERILRSMRTRLKEFELDAMSLRKARTVMEKHLASHDYATRDELCRVLETKGIATSDNRASHIFIEAELQKVICSGPLQGNAQTYALFDKRVTHSPALSREEALQRIATRYYQSRGPATVQDFAWWAGITKGDAERATQMLEPDLHTMKVGDRCLYHYELDSTAKTKAKTQLLLLPAFDEFIIAYSDRCDILSPHMHERSISVNGIFRPVLLHGSNTLGIWRRLQKSKNVVFSYELMEEEPKDFVAQLANAIESYQDFVGQTVLVS